MTKADIAVLVLKIVGAFPSILSVLELVNYAMNPAGYRFGTEIAGFQYNSPAYFVISNVIVMVLYGLAYVLKGTSPRILALIAQLALFATMIEYH